MHTLHSTKNSVWTVLCFLADILTSAFIVPKQGHKRFEPQSSDCERKFKPPFYSHFLGTDLFALVS